MAGFGLFAPVRCVQNDKHVRTHQIEVAKQFNKALEPWGVVVTPSQQPDSRAVSIYESHVDGMIYRNHMDCFAEILDTLLRKKNKRWIYEAQHICITSLTQVGKTSALNLLSALPPIVWLLTGESLLIMRLLINDCSLETQAIEEANNFISLYGDFDFSRKGCPSKNVTVKTYMEEVKKFAARSLDVETHPVGCMMRTSPSMKNAVGNIWEVCKEVGFKPIVLIDESHARSDSNGVMSDMLQREIETEHKHWLDRGMSLFGMSATNFALGYSLMKLGYKPPIFLGPSEGYTGYPWEPITGKRVKVDNVPVVKTISDLSPSLALFQIDCLANKEKAEKNGIINITAYRSKFCRELAKVVKLLLLEENPAQGKGMIIRLCNNNTTTELIRLELQKLIPEINVIPSYNSDGTEKDKKNKHVPSLKKHIHKHDNDKPYIVFVTGRGRMGTAAPQNLRYGLDFTIESEFQTLIQGIPGRLTGYGKGQPLVILSENNASVLKNFIETGKIYNHKGKLISPYAKHIGGEFDENKRTLTVIDRDFSIEVLDYLNDLIKKTYTLPPTGGIDENGKIKRHLVRKTGAENYILPWKIVDSDYLHEMEKKNGCKVLRPGEIAPSPKSGETEMMEINKHGKVKIAVRYDSNQSRRNSNARRGVVSNLGHGVAENEVVVAIIVDDQLEVVEVHWRTWPYSAKSNVVKPASVYHPEEE